MKQLAFGALFLPMFFLGGCSLETAPSIDATALNVVVKKVQDLTVKACSFLPASHSVVAIIAASDPLVMSAVALADAICKAVTTPAPTGEPAPAVLGLGEKADVAPCALVEGVCVEGKFVDPNALPKEDAQ